MKFFLLTKPGIILGNLITMSAGFCLASLKSFDLFKFLAVVIGLSFVIASACVFNNYTDQCTDRKMVRTCHRSLAEGSISPRSAILFGIALGCIGIAILLEGTNILAAGMALSGFIIYVLLYGKEKYRTYYGTIIGSFSGGIPPLVGYCGAGQGIDGGACLLFMSLVFWQMPHFYSISLYRLDEYASTTVALLPLKKSTFVTKVHILLYIIAFLFVSVLLFSCGYTGVGFLIAASFLSAFWLWLAIQGFSCRDEKRWARGMFRFSLVVIACLSLIILLERVM